MAYEKKDNYPSYKKPGVYPSGSIKELGLNNDDLEKFSLGNWNSITKNNRKFFVPQQDSLLNDFLNGKTLGRPVLISNILPVNFLQGNIGFFSQKVLTHPSSNFLRFVSQPAWPSRAGYLYNTFGLDNFNYNIVKDYSQSDINQISNFLTERYNELKEILDNNYAYILPDDTDVEGLSDGEKVQIPIRFRFEPEVQEQINEILSQQITKGTDTLSVNQIRAQKNGLEDFGFPQDWPEDSRTQEFHTYQLYISPPTQHDDGTPLIPESNEQYPPDENYLFDVYAEEDYLTLNTVNIPTADGFLFRFFVQSIDDDGIYTGVFSAGEEDGISALNASQRFGGHPNYPIRFPFVDENIVPELIPDKVDFKVFCTPSSDLIGVEQNKFESVQEQKDSFLYYEFEDERYTSTSYPIKVDLSISVENTNFVQFRNQETIIDEDLTSELFQLFSTTKDDQINSLVSGDFGNLNSIDTSVFYYKVIQWGDEKKLLTDDDILNTEYFKIYDFEEYPGNDNYYFKRYRQQILNKVNWEEASYTEMLESNNFKPIKNPSNVSNDLIISNHAYNEPGPKSIKIILMRFTSNMLILNETILVTKNIVINDGNLLSQDFSIFGGTDFNFLPIVDNQAIIGGFDENSNYNNSVSKIVKDDNFVQEDYLERVSSKDYVKKFNDGFLGNTPGQLDLSQTRVFTESRDIYDFIGGDKLEWINQGSGSLPLNSLATDIFIRDDKCVVDLNPTNSEFLTIQNQMGTKEQGILIGDYKVNQPKDGRVQKQGVMRTPLLETDNDNQAF
tara:strand:- start:7585 stop:9939 length:2355 start_codon:yes stop_codon:yes gene_type:complete